MTLELNVKDAVFLSAGKWEIGVSAKCGGNMICLRYDGREIFRPLTDEAQLEANPYIQGSPILLPANKVGVVDPDYRGEFMVALHNHTDEVRTVEGGERVAQLVIVPFIQAAFEIAEELSDTVRGEGGFGSTGKK